MGLLDKVNPKATLGSILKRSLFQGVIGAIVGAVVLLFNDRPRSEHWLVGYGLWILLCVFVGAVWEWQVPEDDGFDSDVDDGLQRCGDKPVIRGKPNQTVIGYTQLRELAGTRHSSVGAGILKTPIFTLVWMLMAHTLGTTCHGQIPEKDLVPHVLHPVELIRIPDVNGNVIEVMKWTTADESKSFVYSVSIALGRSGCQLNNEEKVAQLLNLRHDSEELQNDIREFGLDEVQTSKLSLAADLELRKMKRMLLAVPKLLERCERFDVETISRVIPPRLLIARKSPLRYDGSLYHWLLCKIAGDDVPPLTDPAEDARKKLTVSVE